MEGRRGGEGARGEGGKRVTQAIAQIEEENSRGRATLYGGNGKFAAVREKPKIQSPGVPPLDGKISPQTSPSIGLKSEYHRFGGTLVGNGYQGSPQQVGNSTHPCKHLSTST